jgi:hypothetical protein
MSANLPAKRRGDNTNTHHRDGFDGEGRVIAKTVRAVAKGFQGHGLPPMADPM